MNTYGMCQGFNNFFGFFDPFVLAKLATTSIRVNKVLNDQKSRGIPGPVAPCTPPTVGGEQSTCGKTPR